MPDQTPLPADHGVFHPARKIYRYTLLILVSMLTFGSYFAYDSIGAIAPTLIKVLGINRETIGDLYTAYSVAAIFIVFFGGMLIDKLGTRRASLLFSALVVLGALIVALAESTWVLFLGRFIFGAGSESLVVAQSTILARWFSGKELAMSYGVALTIGRLGTLLSFNTEQLVADYFNDYRYALWAAVIFCLVSFGANLVYNALDLRGERVLKLPPSEGDKIVFADIKRFKPSFWYVTFLCLTFYSAIFPFTDLATDMFHEKWKLPLQAEGSGGFLYQVFSNFLNMFNTAPGTTSIIIFASMVFAPFAGKMVDRVGKRATLMVVGSLILIPCHLVLGVTHINPIYPMVGLGAAFVLVPAAMWPSIPLIVDAKRVGTAFGLMTAIQNFGLGLFPKLNGMLRDATHSYTATQVMFAGLGVLGLVFALLLLRADRREGDHLESGRSKQVGT